MVRRLVCPELRGVGRAWSIAASLAVITACAGPTAPPPPPPPPALALACPANVDVQSMDGAPVTVEFNSPQATGGVAPVNATCSAQPGSFNVGSTTVTCQATDARGQTASCNFTVAVRPPPRLRFSRFLSFGDSLTSGEVGLDPMLRIFLPNESYPAVLDRRLKAYYRFQAPVVVNAGIGGELAADGGLRRFRSVLLQNRPEVVLLMEGTNDLLGLERGADSAMVALKTMVVEAKSLSVAVGLATVPPQRGGGRRDGVARLIPLFNDRIRVLAATENVILIDVYNAMKDDLSLIGQDDLHPTIKGYDVMATAYFEAIKRNFEEGSATTSPGLRDVWRGPF
jgi:lysophospholipase L1-like esterase